jgi:hypothetical protein
MKLKQSRAAAIIRIYFNDAYVHAELVMQIRQQDFTSHRHSSESSNKGKLSSHFATPAAHNRRVCCGFLYYVCRMHSSCGIGHCVVLWSRVASK